MKIVQNNIESILNQHSIIPVVTINNMNEIVPKINSILDKNIKCIEVTLRTKVAFEAIEFIKKNYSKYCILRLFNVYGENQPKGFFIPDMISKVKKKQKIIIDKSVRDFVHVDEISNIINFVIKKNIFSVVNAGSGRGCTLKNIIDKISKKINIKPIVIVNKTTSKIIADMSLLRSLGYKPKKNINGHFNLKIR